MTLSDSPRKPKSFAALFIPLVLLAMVSSGCSYVTELIGVKQQRTDTDFGFVEFEGDAFEWNWYDQEHNVQPWRFTSEYELKRGGRVIGTATDSGEMDRTVRQRVITFQKPSGGMVTSGDLADGDYEVVMDRENRDRPATSDEKVAYFTVRGGELQPYDGPDYMPKAPANPAGVWHYRFAAAHDHD